jgi:hypothetical protein
MKRKVKILKEYYRPIYSNHPHQYQIDLLQQSNGAQPPFFFMAINTNTRYAFAYPILGKNKKIMIQCLNQLLKDTEGHLADVESDEEAGLDSDLAVRWYAETGIGHNVIDDKNHTALGIVDRLIRTLRDMNRPTIHDDSNDPRFRDFTPELMAQLLNIYNNTTHSGLTYWDTDEEGNDVKHTFTPAEMQNDPEEQQKYIMRKLYETEERRERPDFELPIGTWVRYIIPRDVRKKRFLISPERYQIAGRAVNGYILMDAKGHVRNFPRWQLVAYPGLKLQTRVGTDFSQVAKPKGMFDHITNYDPLTRRYVMAWKGIDGTIADESWVSVKTLVTS